MPQTHASEPVRSPRREGRNVPLGLLWIMVLGGGGWLAWEAFRAPLAVEFAAPEKSPVIAEIELPEKSAAPAAIPPILPPPVAQKPAPLPEPEIRRAEMPLTPGTVPQSPAVAELDLVAASQAAEALLKILLESSTLDKRLTAIAEPEEHRVEMQEFFGRGRPKARNFKPANHVPRTLPGQEQTPLFQVTTDRNLKKGAWVRLVLQDEGGFRIDWPLFAETHERRLAAFLEKKSEQPAWFHVVLRRDHALELPEAVRARHLCVNIQGSADGTVNCLAVTPAETPLGRFLEREVEWGTVYVGRLLLQHRAQAGGSPLVVILDCEGAVTGAVFPSGAGKR